MRKNILQLLAMAVILVSCQKEGFVDKRFNQELLPYSRNSWNARLELTGIKTFCPHSDCDASASYQCDLIVNEIGFIEYLCHSYTHCLEPDTSHRTDDKFPHCPSAELLPDKIIPLKDFRLPV